MDFFEEMYNTQTKISAMKKEIAELEEYLDECCSEIKEQGLTSHTFAIIPSKVSRKVNVRWFAQKEPELYERYAHLENPKAVLVMSEMCGGYVEFQKRIREARPTEFEKSAVMNITDLEKDLGKQTIQEFEILGGVETKPSDKMKVVIISPRGIRQTTEAA